MCLQKKTIERQVSYTSIRVNPTHQETCSSIEVDDILQRF